MMAGTIFPIIPLLLLLVLDPISGAQEECDWIDKIRLEQGLVCLGIRLSQCVLSCRYSGEGEYLVDHLKVIGTSDQRNT